MWIENLAFENRTVRDNYNLKSHKYVCITTHQPDTISNPNPNPTTKQHVIVNIQLNIVAYPRCQKNSYEICCCTVCATLGCKYRIYPPERSIFGLAFCGTYIITYVLSRLSPHDNGQAQAKAGLTSRRN